MSEVGRNDPCPCGSGKKYKKCCALKTTLERRVVSKVDSVEAQAGIGRVSGLLSRPIKTGAGVDLAKKVDKGINTKQKGINPAESAADVDPKNDS